jgi:hypothetical protein
MANITAWRPSRNDPPKNEATGEAVIDRITQAIWQAAVKSKGSESPRFWGL